VEPLGKEGRAGLSGPPVPSVHGVVPSLKPYIDKKIIDELFIVEGFK
jgi:hypothetical protein